MGLIRESYITNLSNIVRKKLWTWLRNMELTGNINFLKRQVKFLGVIQPKEPPAWAKRGCDYSKTYKDVKHLWQKWAKKAVHHPTTGA